VTGELLDIAGARALVLAECAPIGAEEVALDDALGRVIAADVASDIDLPPFDASAMDGYALVAGPERELPVVAESRAGHPAPRALAPTEAMRISTGAVVPEGADSVIPQERTDERDGRVRVPAWEAGRNIRRAGEDVHRGEVVLRRGMELGPAELAVLAAVGRPAAPCALRPRVAVLATGDELISPGRPLGPGQIRDSNPYAIAAQSTRAGAEVVCRERIADDPQETREALARVLARSDVACVTGGVSVGRHDHVKGALESLGVEERFWRVALKPGKPTWFGVAPGGGLVFGLPGNPVSAMVTFQLFARPAIMALLGADPYATRTRARLDTPVRRNPEREQAVRCSLSAEPDGWHVRPTKTQGSHVLTSMLGARALALVPAGDGEAAAGERVEIELFD